MNLILFGFKGSGKTYFGSRLSLRLRRPFLDTDRLIEATYSPSTCSCREIFQTIGESAFRALEKACIHELRADTQAVIAIGGGAIEDADNVAHLKRIGSLIYIKASWERVKKHVFDHGIPPFIDPKNPESSLAQRYQTCLPLYASLSTLVFDVELGRDALLDLVHTHEAGSHGIQ